MFVHKGLPVSWLGYPGSRVVGGYLIGYRMTADRCVALCQLYNSCHAIDFNSVDGSCWVHTTLQNKCGAPIPTNHVYHAKKPPACGNLLIYLRTYRYSVVCVEAGKLRYAVTMLKDSTIVQSDPTIRLFVFTARQHSLLYAKRCNSYRKSVRLSVTRWHCTVSKRLQLRSCGLHWRTAP